MNIYFGLIIFILTLSNINAQSKNDTIIYWEKSHKLEWNDFHGVIPYNCGADKAKSDLSLTISFVIRDKLLDANVLCFFNKNKSWIKDSSLLLLKHEQLHFDISELYARKIRKGVFILRNANQTNSEEYTKQVKIFLEEWNALNNQYDEETAHSVNKFKQIEWENKIAKELEELKDYEVD